MLAYFSAVHEKFWCTLKNQWPVHSQKNLKAHDLSNQVGYDSGSGLKQVQAIGIARAPR